MPRGYPLLDKDDPQYIYRRTKRLMALYGITLEQYEQVAKAQNYVCAICSGPATGQGRIHGHFHIDHDAETGQIRGLLCANCNHGLGKFAHDAALMERAIQYLDEGFWEFT